MDEVAGALDGVTLLLLASATMTTTNAATTKPARPATTHTRVLDEVGALAGGGGGLIGGRECGMGAGGLECAVGPEGREWTTGPGGGSSATLAGAAAAEAVFFRCWACSMAWPKT